MYLMILNFTLKNGEDGGGRKGLGEADACFPGGGKLSSSNEKAEEKLCFLFSAKSADRYQQLS